MILKKVYNLITYHAKIAVKITNLYLIRVFSKIYSSPDIIKYGVKPNSEYKENNLTPSSFNPTLSLKSIGQLGVFSSGYKYCGAVLGDDGMIYGIPSGAKNVIKIDPSRNTYELLGDLSDQSFKWTTGCNHTDGCIYGFTRSSNTLLQIDIIKKEVFEINLGLSYKAEHHYSGILYGNRIYQPPRRNNTILCINLDNKMVHQISLTSLPVKMGYTGSILHPNGFVYFMPESWGKVMVFNPETEMITFIGKIVKCSVYNPVVSHNGHIYGFGYSYGILKIEPETNSVSVLFNNIFFGSATTVIGVNGKLYNLVGCSDTLYEFDSDTESLKTIGNINSESCVECKCAGGVVTTDVTICCIPAFADHIYKLMFA